MLKLTMYVALSLITGLMAGCNLFPDQLPANTDPQDSSQTTQDPSSGNPLPADSLGVDGMWRQEASGHMLACCITIQNQVVTILDENCDGHPINIISSRITAYGVGGIVVGVVVADSSEATEYSLYGFTLYEQPDGTLTGTANIQPRPIGEAITANVTWIRQ